MTIFNLNNKGKIPNIQKTIEGVAKLLTVRTRILSSQMTVLPVPLVIASYHNFEEVVYQAPYFQNTPTLFINAFMNANPAQKNIMFFIIANDFTDKEVLNSHMLLGINFASGKRLVIIDPNSNIIEMDNIYQGRGFQKAPKIRNITNPLYNTLLRFFKDTMKIKKIHMRFYSGDPIVCPAGGAVSCSYRTIMIMIGLRAATNNSVKQALEYANYMAVNEFPKVKTLLDKVFNNEANTKTFFEDFLKTLRRQAIRNNYISISPSPSS